VIRKLFFASIIAIVTYVAFIGGQIIGFALLDFVDAAPDTDHTVDIDIRVYHAPLSSSGACSIRQAQTAYDTEIRIDYWPGDNQDSTRTVTGQGVLTYRLPEGDYSWAWGMSRAGGHYPCPNLISDKRTIETRNGVRHIYNYYYHIQPNPDKTFDKAYLPMIGGG
jgi:hypothetical protein